ncbi:hypothetical protein ACNKHR_07425 [Shigella flexneri]
MVDQMLSTLNTFFTDDRFYCLEPVASFDRITSFGKRSTWVIPYLSNNVEFSGTCPIELSPESSIRQVLRLVAALLYALDLQHLLDNFYQKNH